MSEVRQISDWHPFDLESRPFVNDVARLLIVDDPRSTDTPEGGRIIETYLTRAVDGLGKYRKPPFDPLSLHRSKTPAASK